MDEILELLTSQELCFRCPRPSAVTVAVQAKGSPARHSSKQRLTRDSFRQPSSSGSHRTTIGRRASPNREQLVSCRRTPQFVPRPPGECRWIGKQRSPVHGRTRASPSGAYKSSADRAVIQLIACRTPQQRFSIRVLRGIRRGLEPDSCGHDAQPNRQAQ